MPRLLSVTLVATLFSALSVTAQSQDPGSAQAPPPPQNSTAPADTKKQKKIWTNENLSDAGGTVSVVGDNKNKPKSGSVPKTANDQYIANTKKQLEKLQKQVEDTDKQIVDLKNFSAGESSSNASGIKLNKSYNREPIDVQIRTLEDKKKDLQSQIEALLDEARKKGVEPGQLR